MVPIRPDKPLASPTIVANAASELNSVPADWAVNGEKRPQAPVKRRTVETSDRLAEPELPELTTTSEGDASFHGACDLATGGGGITPDEMLAMFMGYLKSVAHEVRENAQLRNMSRELVMFAKNAVITAENDAIDASLRDAAAKADIAMTAAWTGLALGIASGLVGIGAGLGSYTASNMRNEALHMDPLDQQKGLGEATKWQLGADLLSSLNPMLQGMNSFTQGKAEHDKQMIDAAPTSGQAMKKEVNRRQALENEIEARDKKAEDDLQLARDHQKAMKETFKKCMDLRSQSLKAAVDFGR